MLEIRSGLLIVLIILTYSKINCKNYFQTADVAREDVNYIVSIQMDGKHQCSGTLISKDTVITSSNCGMRPYVMELDKNIIVQSPIPYEFHVLVGVYDPAQFQMADKYEISYVKIDHDARIALLKLIKEVVFTDEVGIVSLWNQEVDGELQEMNNQIAIPVYSIVCKQMVFLHLKAYHSISMDDTVDVCEDDVGAPLIWKQKQIGIVRSVSEKLMDLVTSFDSHWVMEMRGDTIPTKQYRVTEYTDKYVVPLTYNDQYRCVGSFIRKSWIITSKRCIDNTTKSDWKAYIGLLDIAKIATDELLRKVDYYTVLDIVLYQDYDFRSEFSPLFFFDVALMRLDGVSVNHQVLPKIPVKTNDECYAVGWGRAPKIKSGKPKRIKRVLFDEHPTEYVMQYTTYKVKPLSDCTGIIYQNYNPVQFTAYLKDIQSFICVVSKKAWQPTWYDHTCLSVVGAPLNCGGVFIGMSNSGAGCSVGNVYCKGCEIYTRIDGFNWWIEQIVDGKLFGEAHRESYSITSEYLKVWKYLVSVRTPNSNGVQKHKCVGILIQKNQVLVSGHCLLSARYDDQSPQVGLVKSGTISNVDVYKVTKIVYSEDERHIPPIFKHHVMAIMSFKGNWANLSHVSHDVFSTNTSVDPGIVCKTAGWNFYSKQNRTLREVMVKVVSISVCVDYYGELDTRDMIPGYDNYLCTMPVDRLNHDTCLIEQTPPLVCDGNIIALGAIKYGCREKLRGISPTLWFRLDYRLYFDYASWIDRNTKITVRSKQIKTRMRPSKREFVYVPAKRDSAIRNSFCICLMIMTFIV